VFGNRENSGIKGTGALMRARKIIFKFFNSAETENKVVFGCRPAKGRAPAAMRPPVPAMPLTAKDDVYSKD